MPEEFNSDLLDDLAMRKVVFFIGAGLSIGCEEGDATPFLTWHQLIGEGLKLLAGKESEIVGRYIEKGDLISAAQFIKEYESDKWESLLKKEFQKPSTPGASHREIIMLKPKIVITTNYDKLIEKAWYENRKESDPTVINYIDNKTLSHIRKDQNCVIHIHGNYDDVDNIVIGTDGYHRNAFFNEYYKMLMITILLTQTIVFIGTSLSDPVISLLLDEVTHKYHGVRPHYMISTRNYEVEEVQYIKKYKNIITIICEKDGIHELLRRLREKVDKRRNEYLLNFP